ncbi:MAG: mechanosensitive ion channel [Desulfobacterales bacterium]|nr:mechanosensitive ion channel [Desulfobacterales bacterium]MDD4071535.1 mechanosensitive ion channel [Desulfobacterales bacterium]MDD4391821.1 mechanosensitive ion channel [Desulfobacterales bacterium]
MENNTTLLELLAEFNMVNIFTVLFIIGSAWLIIFLMERLIPWFAEKVPGRKRLLILSSVPFLRLLVMILAVGLIIPIVIKPTLQNLVAIFGVAGLALGFAFKDYVSSLIAGIVTIYEQPYRPGDWVKIDGAYGEVKSIGLRTLKMVTPDDTVVIIPHTKIWNTNIFNANSGHRDLQCIADFYLHPAHDAGKVRQKLYDVALTSPYTMLEKPVVVMVSEKPWGTHYRLKAYPVDGRDQFRFISDMTVRGKAALTRMDVKWVSQCCLTSF